MANRYWVGNGGSWNDTAHWSNVSGGVGGFSVPVSADDVFFNSSSFTVDDETVALASSASFHDLTYSPTKNTTFTTNGYAISANRITFSTNWALTLNLGSSSITTHGWAYRINSDIHGTSYLNSGTSVITISPPFSDFGFENVSFNTQETYYDIVIQGDGTATPGYVGGAFYILGSTGFSCRNLTFSNAPLLVSWRDFQSGIYNTTYSTRILTANGSAGKLFTFFSESSGDAWKIQALTASLSYVDASDSYASGAVPFNDSIGGVDSGGNVNWCFTDTCMSLFLQTTQLVGANTGGNVQTINSGKSDDSIPIYYELETQGIEFGNVFHRKKISDRIVVFTKNGLDSSLQGKSIDGNYEDIEVELDRRVNIGEKIDLEGNTIMFKWFGEANESTPVFEGIYLERVTDMGITKG